MDVQETRLPGIGKRHDFVTKAGRGIGVVTHRSGQRDLVLFDQRDPDACTASLPLTGEESDALAQLLGAPTIAGRLSDLAEDIPGLAVERIIVRTGSALAGRTLAESRPRQTGASIAAVLHEGGVTAAPGPDTPLSPGDTIVVVGSPESVEALAALAAP
jgi:TrkA domain protein